MTDRLAAGVVTCFANHQWDLFAKRMLESFVQYWPKEIAILVVLDDDKLVPDVEKIIRPNDGFICGWTKEHEEFVERNKDKDHPTDYRKQAIRFCHKVFTLKGAANYWRDYKGDDGARYLIWLDADVLTTRHVTLEEIRACLPKEGDAVAYLGRKDWDHSECGWMAFDLKNHGAIELIDSIYDAYATDFVFTLDQWHDSYVFDHRFKYRNIKGTNLTVVATGMEVWPQSPMAAWSRHYKGPIAKQELALEKKPKSEGKVAPLRIETMNSIPNKDIHNNILENQTLIKNWIRTCLPTDEEIVIVSAGPTLNPYDLLEEVAAGRKIVAVKHAMKPLREAGIKPWGCILLDPREHVYDFVDTEDKEVIWFVASQVTPRATKKLIDAGCNVWGYHASVGADEGSLTDRQFDAIVHGGSATATRGIYVLNKLGFSKFRLYGYDLSLVSKPDLSEKDDRGQPAYFEVELTVPMPHYMEKRWFWSKGELLAQANELQEIMLRNSKFDVKAFGNGIGPFFYTVKKISDLKGREKIAKLGFPKPRHYRDLFGCSNKTHLLARWLSKLL